MDCLLRGIKFRKLNTQHKEYLWRNMRPYDKVEFVANGFTDENYREMMNVATESICALDRGTPLCAWQHYELMNCVQFGFFGTENVQHWWKDITEIANLYIDNILTRYFPKAGTIIVWQDHKESRRWIERYLGFELVEAPYFDLKGKRFLMYRKGVKM